MHKTKLEFCLESKCSRDDLFLIIWVEYLWTSWKTKCTFTNKNPRVRTLSASWKTCGKKFAFLIPKNIQYNFIDFIFNMKISVSKQTE